MAKVTLPADLEFPPLGSPDVKVEFGPRKGKTKPKVSKDEPFVFVPLSEAELNAEASSAPPLPFTANRFAVLADPELEPGEVVDTPKSQLQVAVKVPRAVESPALRTKNPEPKGKEKMSSTKKISTKEAPKSPADVSKEDSSKQTKKKARTGKKPGVAKPQVAKPAPNARVADSAKQPKEKKTLKPSPTPEEDLSSAPPPLVDSDDEGEDPKVEEEPTKPAKEVNPRPRNRSNSDPARANRAFQIPVKVNERSDEQRFCEEQGIPFEHAVVPANPHGLGALQRLKGTQYALARLCDMQAGKQIVVDLYGSKRTLTVAKQLRGIGFELDVHVHGPALVPADILRRTPEQFDHRIKATSLLLVNVYALGDVPLTAANLAHVMSYYAVKHAALVVHSFPDAMGVVAKRGAYVRVDKSSVIMRASPEDRVYGPHSALDWLLADGYSDGISWTRDRGIGDIDVYLISLQELQARSLVVAPVTQWKQTSIIDQRTWYGWGSLRLPSLLRRFVDWIVPVPRRQGFVSRRLVLEAKTFLARVALNRNSSKSVTSHLQTVMAGPAFAPISKCFPEYTERMVNDAVHEAMAEMAREDALDFEAFNSEHGEYVHRRAREMNAVGTAPVDPTWRFAIYLAGALLLTSPALREIVSQTAIGLGAGIWRATRQTFKLAVWEKYPVLSAVMEEAVRWIVISVAGPLSWAYPVLLAMADERSLLPSLTRLASHFALHACAYFSPLLALGTHAINNMRGVVPPTPWQQFKDTYLEAPIENVPPMTDPNVSITALPLDEQRVACRMDVEYDRLPGRMSELKSVTGLERLVGSHGPQSYSFHMFAVNAPFVVPGASDDVAHFAIVSRLCKATPLECHPQVKVRPDGKMNEEDWRFVLARHENLWEFISDFFGYWTRELFIAGVDVNSLEREEILPAWLDHLKANKAKLIEACARNDTMEIFARTCKVMIKRNELLLSRDHVAKLGRTFDASDRALVAKARTIAAQDPREVAFNGPFVYTAWERIKQACHPRIWERRAFDFKPPSHGFQDYWKNAKPLRAMVVFGPISDLEFSELSTYLANLQEELAVFLFTGDDTCGLARCLVDGVLVSINIKNDFSQFDVSQFANVQETPINMLKCAGLPERIAQNLRDESTRGYVFTSKISGAQVHVDVSDCGDMKTGSSATTPKNSGSNAGAIITTLVRCGGTEFLRDLARELSVRPVGEDVGAGDSANLSEFELRTLDLGFKCKLAGARGFTGAIFLKHVLLPAHRDLTAKTGDVFLAYLLPSQIIKRGKSLRDPVEIYRVPREKACLAFLRDAARGMIHSWLPPLLECFRAKYMSCAHDVEKVWTDPEDEYRMLGRAGLFLGLPKFSWTADKTTLWVWGRRRYGPAWDDHELLAGIIMQAPAFCFIEHPLFEAMAEADYA